MAAATFSGELQVQSSRPVFNSTYTSTLLNVNDKDIDFTYTEGQTIDYTDQNFQSNLSSIMAFYAYIIVGMDYDTFSQIWRHALFCSWPKRWLPMHKHHPIKAGKLLTVI